MVSTRSMTAAAAAALSVSILNSTDDSLATVARHSAILLPDRPNETRKGERIKKADKTEIMISSNDCIVGNTLPVAAAVAATAAIFEPRIVELAICDTNEVATTSTSNATETTAQVEWARQTVTKTNAAFGALPPVDKTLSDDAMPVTPSAALKRPSQVRPINAVTTDPVIAKEPRICRNIDAGKTAEVSKAADVIALPAQELNDAAWANETTATATATATVTATAAESVAIPLRLAPQQVTSLDQLADPALKVAYASLSGLAVVGAVSESAIINATDPLDGKGNLLTTIISPIKSAMTTSSMVDWLYWFMRAGVQTICLLRYGNKFFSLAAALLNYLPNTPIIMWAVALNAVSTIIGRNVAWSAYIVWIAIYYTLPFMLPKVGFLILGCE
ncbi:hypothetical protein MPSEU_001083800 [Mayamaea pseudoterrestris]|nr:hypothetical protein MPSEU_001083800 [Mayamaea pseudoterrestris]